MQPMQGYFFLIEGDLLKFEKSGPFCIVFFFQKAINVHTLHDLTDPPRLRENFEKWCNLVRIGVYFDQMFLKIIPKIVIF